MGRLKPWLPRLAWFGLLVSLGTASWESLIVWRLRDLNGAISDGSLIARGTLPDDPPIRYAAGWLHAREGNLREAARRFAEAEAAPDPQLAARAKLGLGNLYFTLGISAANVAEGGSHQQGTAQLELAREAYRGALRIAPDLREARYNLELLERIGPERRSQGWARETDGVSLQAFKRDGWAQMKDNPKRGLP